MRHPRALVLAFAAVALAAPAAAQAPDHWLTAERDRLARQQMDARAAEQAALARADQRRTEQVLRRIEAARLPSPPPPRVIDDPDLDRLEAEARRRDTELRLRQIDAWLDNAPRR